MSEQTTTTPAAANKLQDGRRSGGDRRGGGRGPRRRQEREPREFEQQILSLDRVTRVTTGGKRMRFRAGLVIGDKKGRVGFGLAKGADVQLALQKAYTQAKKNVIMVPTVNGTFPHRQIGAFGSAEIMLKPAPKGTGLKSGGAIRTILDLAGVHDAVSKNFGTRNKMNVARATFDALKKMVIPEGTLTDAEKAMADRKAKRTEEAKKVTKRTPRVTKKKSESPKN